MSAFNSYFETHQRVVADSMAALLDVQGAAGEAIVTALDVGNKVIAFGNGGSATQASHLAGELIGRFKHTRRAFPAIALVGDAGSVTCIANDFGYGAVFERQIEALIQPGDIAIGLTTSGRSENVLRGLAAAKSRGGVTIALTGRSGAQGDMAVDHLLAVPSDETAHIQEVHIMLIHFWCTLVDKLPT